jgi:hypothetical protein
VEARENDVGYGGRGIVQDFDGGVILQLNAKT